MRTITADNPVMPPDAVLLECGEVSYGMGNRWVIDWEMFYNALDSAGYDMQDLGGTVDTRIRRKVRQWVRDGDIS